MKLRLLSLLFLAGFAYALPLTVDNSSFETTAVPDGAVGAVTSWSGGFAFNPTAGAAPAVPLGLQVLFLQATNSSSQLLSDVLTANTMYTLTVAVGSRADFNFINTYTIALEAGAAVLASASSPTPANGTFTDVSVQYTALATDVNLGQQIRIRLSHSAAGSNTALFDNVRLDATPVVDEPVPEPSSLALVVSTIALLLLRRRQAGEGPARASQPS